MKPRDHVAGIHNRKRAIMIRSISPQPSRDHRKRGVEYDRTDPTVVAPTIAVDSETVVPKTGTDVREERVMKQKAIDNWEDEGGQMPTT